MVFYFLGQTCLGICPLEFLLHQDLRSTLDPHHLATYITQDPECLDPCHHASEAHHHQVRLTWFNLVSGHWMTQFLGNCLLATEVLDAFYLTIHVMTHKKFTSLWRKYILTVYYVINSSIFFKENLLGIIHNFGQDEDGKCEWSLMWHKVLIFQFFVSSNTGNLKHQIYNYKIDSLDQCINFVWKSKKY